MNQHGATFVLLLIYATNISYFYNLFFLAGNYCEYYLQTGFDFTHALT